MTKDEIVGQLLAHKEAEYQAIQIRRKKYAEADDEYGLVVTPIKYFKLRLEDTYKERAFELAIEQGKCPVSPWKVPRIPDDVTITEDGVGLTWDIDGRYVYCTIKWDDLLKGEENE